METELWKYLKNAKKPIVLYGMGNGADKILNVLDLYGIKINGVFASDSFVRNKTYRGFKICSYGELKEKFGDMIVLLAFGSQLPDVITNILKIANEQELYAPDVPVISKGLFTEEYLKTNQKAFEYTYSLLADNTSKKTFENIINYKLSGKISYLLDCEVSYEEPFQNILKLGSNERFLDLGAYNGDTVKEFISKVENFSHITAIEPDFKNFKKLTVSVQQLDRITCINACVCDTCGKKFFSMRSGRNSGLSDNGTLIDSVTVDSLDFSPTYIKMDVEGEEVPAIRGAFSTIKNHKPKMLISAYHRTDDLISIPKAVFNIRDDYKLYLRHFSYLPAWDTNFYFV